MKINDQKKILRKSCSQKRAELKQNDKKASLMLQKNFLKFENLDKIKTIASFISINTEISTELLNSFLLSLGKKICFPVILNDNNYLIFRTYKKNGKLKKGKYGVLEPIDSDQELYPELILTPCLAFDLIGYRLGYGGGYYDQTFNYLEKNNHNFISIILAYADQKVDKIVHDNLDKKNHYILTEKELYKIK